MPHTNGGFPECFETKLLPELPGPGSNETSTPWTAAASLASTSSGTVDSTVGTGVGVGAWVGMGDGAAIEHARLNTAIPPSSLVAAMDTKTLLELAFVDCVMAVIIPLIVSASLPTLTVLGEYRDPVEASL